MSSGDAKLASNTMLAAAAWSSVMKENTWFVPRVVPLIVCEFEPIVTVYVCSADIELLRSRVIVGAPSPLAFVKLNPPSIEAFDKTELASIFELVNITNKKIDDLNFAKNAKSLLEELLDILGVSLQKDVAVLTEPVGMSTTLHKPTVITITDEEIKDKITLRSKYRKEKKFREADKVRQELAEKGVILEDEKDGTVWRRKL